MSVTPESSRMFLCSRSAPHSQALANIDLVFIFFVLPFQGCHRHGILTVGPFESLASFSYQTFLRSIHLDAWSVVCSILTLSRVLSEDVAQRVCSLVNGHRGSFQLAAIINKTATDITYKLLYECVSSFLLGKYLGVGLLGCLVKCMQNFMRNRKTVFKGGYAIL